jgi:hypothetical protein
MSVRLCDEFEGGFGWVEEGFLQRASHALELDGRVLLFDPVDDPAFDERIRALGEPAAVVQLLDRHARDCGAIAGRLGVPHLEMRLEGMAPGAELLPVAWNRFWREAAFWEPRRGVLVVGDALGTVGYFKTPDEALGVHPLLRLRPPKALAGLAPTHVLCGHGDGVHGEEAALALRHALETSRRGLPRAILSGLRRQP